MKPEKVLEVLETYRAKFEELGISKADYPHEVLMDGRDHTVMETNKQVLRHLHGMLDKAKEFVAQGRIQKAMRWLGFIQGGLWSEAIYTLEELKNHNRP